MPQGSDRATRVLFDGFGMGESPRWHDGRLWFSNWSANEVVAVDLDGSSEVMGQGGGGSGWATNWLPDGRMLITGSELIRVEPDGARVRHADGGLTNRRVWADVTGDGICIDAEGAVWCSDVGVGDSGVVQRVREGGEVLDRIELDRPCYACMLGGDDGATLFMVAAKWFGPDRMDELQQAKTGQILTARVDVPHAGWP